MGAFSARIDLDDRMTPGLSRLKDAAGDLSVPFGQIAIEVLEHTQDRFQYQYDPDGVPWEPSKRVLEEGGDTLFLHGWLFRSLTNDHGKDFAAVGVEATGPAAIYARTHQEGATIHPRADSGKKALKTPFGPRGSVTIPARPFLGIEERDLTSVEAIILDWLAQNASGSGSKGKSA